MKQRALALLARREHSEKELRGKLLARDLDAEDVDQVLAELQQEGLQSDMRFAEALVHHRAGRGYGPRHIAQELKQKGVADYISEEFIDERDPAWLERMREVREGKFGSEAPAEYKEQARQSRFLQYRGFAGDQIQRLFKNLKNDED